MSRVIKVMVLLVTMSLVAAVSLQPSAAFAGELPVYQDTNTGGDDGDQAIGTCGDPTDTGEGDPDSVGGGYGAHAGSTDLSGLFDGLFGAGDDDRDVKTIEEFIRLMLQQFMPKP